MNSFPQIEIELLKNLYQPFGVEVSVMRLDKIHPLVSGNKWFKLKEYLREAKELNKTTILTFGGAYSNHIVATAAACNKTGLQSVGIIRGEEPVKFSPSLMDAQGHGMQLYFVSREKYKVKAIPEVITEKFKKEIIYSIPEGGYGPLGCKGASSILDGSTKNYTHILAAVGTGTTLAGLVCSSQPHQNIIGISTLKNHRGLEQEINALLPEEKKDQFTLMQDYHFGGYAKTTPELIAFINGWYSQTGIPSDFVYTGKLFSAAHDLIQQNYFPPESKLLIIHSGGLQGNRSQSNETLIFFNLFLLTLLYLHGFC